MDEKVKGNELQTSSYKIIHGDVMYSTGTIVNYVIMTYG